MKAAPSILVLADDLTGAAEIAAIGVEHGLRTELATAVPQKSRADLLVIDTDTRPLSGPDAAARIGAIMAALPRTPFFFKKTDSVLRGQVLPELRALQKSLGTPAALLVPQNPSKGRVIVAGQYLIDDLPLEQTSFRNDPEYPRLMSKVLSLLAGSALPAGLRVADPDSLAPPAAELSDGITIGNAATADHIRQWAAIATRANCLLAGGADLFHAFLEHLGHSVTPQPHVPLLPGTTLIICGSTADYSRNLVEQWHRRGCVTPLPERTGAVSSADSWAQAAATHLHGPQSRAVLAIRHPISSDRAVAYRGCMAETVRRLVNSVDAELTLIIEGGATAAAITDALGWTDFHVLGNLSPGVVAMRPLSSTGSLRIILKPGSYPWPSELLETCGLPAH